jgi:predicted nucleotidyltransferase
LKEIAADCVTRHHSHHYLGFAATQWNLFQKEEPPRIKPLLYVYRVLLTGIHLMRTGEVEANLVVLNEEFKLPYVPELVERKILGAEKGTLASNEADFHKREYERLVAQLLRPTIRSFRMNPAAATPSMTCSFVFDWSKGIMRNTGNPHESEREAA